MRFKTGMLCLAALTPAMFAGGCAEMVHQITPTAYRVYKMKDPETLNDRDKFEKVVDVNLEQIAKAAFDVVKFAIDGTVGVITNILKLTGLVVVADSDPGTRPPPPAVAVTSESLTTPAVNATP